MAAAEAKQKPVDADEAPKVLQLENTAKRDALTQEEVKYQKAWKENGVFQTNAPSTAEFPFGSTSASELHKMHPKFFGVMAYPYMNGTLHAGHSFTVSKIEFAAGVARMQGKRALYPQGYHCTGMPIKACADKLVREIEMFGEDFSGYKGDLTVNGDAGEHVPAPTQAQTKEDITKFTAKKSKAAAKSTGMRYQFQIMEKLGLERSQIARFANPATWLEYFPQLCERDLTNFGCRIDWRRSVVTTDANLYYDSFVRWQMNHLRDLGKIKFGKRYTVYSPKDGQACMDHDRSEGEGVGVQEYTALKLKVKEWPETARAKLEGKFPKDANVYLVPATLRPETMYGQNCCFVGPSIKYGIFSIGKDSKDYFFCSERAARNMAYQTIFAAQVWGGYTQVAELMGSDVIGALVNAPLSVHKEVRILPMESVKATKGTGVVTCVPSDSPDDYATIIDLAKKAEYYGIKKEWAELEIVPVIETPTYGKLTAKKLVEDMKINSPKDVKQLAEAKDLAYKEGFYKGTMLIGDFKGESVVEAKVKVRQQLIDSGDAFNYAEPDGFVLSRSGDDCVAAHLDQWYLNYGTTEKGGDGEWQKQVLDHVNGELDTFSTDVKNAFQQTLDWLSQWACARSYGLGSKLPWDTKFLVESLSDSTIYMSYYTIAHLLHKDIFGKEIGPANVRPEQMTDEVWDYVFTKRNHISCDIPQATLETMRREFEYWYPVDVNVSGKDLIQNHLTFFLYVHAALFPKELWPRGIRANGHLLLNSEKMSKSTGNFMTLKDAIDKYGADATRIALADAGDGMDDANFDETVANSNILRMFELREWCKGMVQDAIEVPSEEGYAKERDAKKHRNADWIQRTGGERHFFDDIFEDEMNGLVKETQKHYEGALYKAALKSGLYDFTGARDAYREATKASGIGMHKDLVRRYVEYQALLLTPIAPHWAEYVWLEILKKPDTVQNAVFPAVSPQDAKLTAAREYARTTASSITSSEAAQQKKVAKGKGGAFDPKREKKITIFVARNFPAWQDNAIELVRRNFSNMTVDVKGVSQKLPKAETKKAMPFVTALKKRLESGEDAEVVFDRKLAFDEVEVLKQVVVGLKQAVNKCTAVEIVAVEEGGKKGEVVGGTERVAVGEKRDDLPLFAEHCIPGQPTFNFVNVD